MTSGLILKHDCHIDLVELSCASSLEYMLAHLLSVRSEVHYAMIRDLVFAGL